MIIKVLGHKDSLYVVQTPSDPEDTARIVDIDAVHSFPPTPLASIAVHGRWKEVTHPPTALIEAALAAKPILPAKKKRPVSKFNPTRSTA